MFTRKTPNYETVKKWKDGKEKMPEVFYSFHIVNIRLWLNKLRA